MAINRVIMWGNVNQCVISLRKFFKTAFTNIENSSIMDGLNGTHLRRFNTDNARFLSAYGVFHGDERHPGGEPLPTGSLKRTTLSVSLPYHDVTPGPPSSYVIQPTLSLRALSQRTSGGSLGKTLPSNRSVGLQQTVYQFNTGGTFSSTSGLPPNQYKGWSTEYVDEFRGPSARKAILQDLTQMHGTVDALRTNRYQFQGYPHSFKSYSPSSMTFKGQVKPDYESRVKAF